MNRSSDRDINSRPKAKFPALHVGGLDPPPVGSKPRGFRPPFQSEPLPVPCPKPRPRSLTLGSEEDTSQKVDLPPRTLESVQPPIDSKVLVPYTSTPPEICRYSRGSFQTAIQHWKETKSGYETWFASLISYFHPWAHRLWIFIHEQLILQSLGWNILGQLGKNWPYPYWYRFCTWLRRPPEVTSKQFASNHKPFYEA